MIKLYPLLVLLDLMRVIEGPQLDPTAITCYVCSSLDRKDCEDPMSAEGVRQSIPFFECSRLYGVFDQQNVKYIHFRPTNHGKKTDGWTNVTNTKAPGNDNLTAPKASRNRSTHIANDEAGRKLANTHKDSIITQFRHHWTSESEHPSQTFVENFEEGNGIWHFLFAIINSQLRKKERRIQPHGYADEGKSEYEFEFFPFRTQRGPKGIPERPQHYCYKLIFDHKPHEVIQRGCTNITTKSNACNHYLKKFSNVTKCEFCGLNFCNGIKETMNVATLRIIISKLVFSLVVNKIRPT